jgi:threonine/homoserine/homoserine lactone efflux protein
MPEWSTLCLFVVAASILVIVPGPNTLYIITRSLQQGIAAGIVSCLGVMVGTLFHITAAALGISALLMSSALAFTLVKYAGAAYLIYLGVRTILTKEKFSTGAKPVPAKSLGGIFYQGIVVNLLNPKTALFFMAFLPQFVDVGRGSPAMQICFLGAVLVVLGGISDMTYALLAGKFGELLRGSSRFLAARRYLAGFVYIGLGAATALTGTDRK